MAKGAHKQVGAAFALVLLAACGRGERSTDDPVAQNVASAAADRMAANVAAAMDCSNRPDFVPVYADAEITSCVAGRDGLSTGHVSGTIVYMTAAAPKQVLGWSRAQANASGLRYGRETATMYQAGEEAQRSVMVVVDSFEGRTRVTVNWGQEP